MTSDVLATRGRPRDPDMEVRVFDAAIAVYSERGWSGFTLDAVARTAGVGNAAIYRRWTSKEDLLTQAVQANTRSLDPIDTGSSHEDLLALARRFLLEYFVPSGMVGLRLMLDARTNTQLAESFESVLHSQRRDTALTVLRRAAARGDLASTTTPGAAMEVLAGATLSHFLYHPRDAALPPDRTTPSEERFLARVVAGLLRD